MTIIQEKAGKFLAAHGMAAEAVNLRENADVFIGEMERGLKGEESSLFMIPTLSLIHILCIRDRPRPRPL